MRALATTHTVDDDGCTGCYTSIQVAVDAAGNGDTINVQPGVYNSFVVSGTGNLTVSGIFADAVFVDGSGGDFAVKIQNATGVKLEKLTLRDAADAIYLDDAGVGGHDDPAKQTVLDTLLIYDFSSHAVTMDRASTASLTRCTLAGGDNHIHVYGDPDPAVDANWTTEDTNSWAATYEGGGIATDGADIHVARGGGSDQVHKYTMSGTWYTYPATPRGLGVGSAMTADENSRLWALRGDDFLGGFDDTVHAIEYVSANQIYVGGEFQRAGGVSTDYIAEWDGSRWQPMSGPNAPTGPVFAIEASGGNVYVGGGFGLRRWDGGNWSNLADLDYQGQGDAVFALLVDGSNVYVGGRFRQIGGISANHIARWDGDWHYVGSSDSNKNGVAGNPEWHAIAVYALAIGDVNDSQYVYVGGNFDVGQNPSGDVTSYNFIRLNKNTNTWYSAKGGIDDDPWDEDAEVVYAISPQTFGCKIVLGGDFSGVEPNNPKLAENLALWWTCDANWDHDYRDKLAANGEVRSIILGKHRSWFTLYVGGYFR